MIMILKLGGSGKDIFRTARFEVEYRLGILKVVGLNVSEQEGPGM